MKNSELVTQFIDQIWNSRDFNSLDKYVHDEFKDHSLHRPLPGNKNDLKIWIEGVGASFEHKTIIESQVTEGDFSIIKIKMKLKHTGAWRNINPTGFELEATGFRQFRFSEGMIIEHWALIDGQTIESLLLNASVRCVIKDK